MKQMSTEIEISADVVRVWKVLTGFARFPEWNDGVEKSHVPDPPSISR